MQNMMITIKVRPFHNSSARNECRKVADVYAYLSTAYKKRTNENTESYTGTLIKCVRYLYSLVLKLLPTTGFYFF